MTTSREMTQRKYNLKFIYSILFLLSIAHLESKLAYAIDFELCDQGDITSKNGSVFLNISASDLMEGDTECERLIFLDEGRVKITIDKGQTFSQENDVLRIFDRRDHISKKLTPNGTEGQEIYETTGNMMGIRLKVGKRSKSSEAFVFHGSFVSLPFEATCECTGISNGVDQRCRDSYGVRYCQVSCKNGFMDLTGSTGNFACDLLNGKWDKDPESLGFGCQSTVIPSVRVHLNISSSFANSFLCSNSTKENISSLLQSYLKVRENLSINGECLEGIEDNNCIIIDCVHIINSSIVSLTIDDKARRINSSTFNELFAAYNDVSFEGIVKRLYGFITINSNSTNNNTVYKVQTSVRRQCPTGMFLFNALPGSVGNPVCAQCPNGSFYNESHCEKCPKVKSSLRDSESCFSSGSPNIGPSSKDSCKIYCSMGEGVSRKTGFCQWCPQNTYQNGTDVPNVECSACPEGHMTTSPGATGFQQCFQHCPNGTFLDPRNRYCPSCAMGTYQDAINHVYMKCRKCAKGKVTYGTGSTAPTQCVPSCKKGHYLYSSTSHCLKCPLGSYQDRINQLNCTQCTEETSTLNNGSTQSSDCIKTCQMGTYFDVHETSCFECQNGSYMDQSGHLITTCIKCAGNKTTLTHGAVNETQCLNNCGLGENFDVSNTSCTKCLLGYYMDQRDHLESSCTMCGAQKTTLDKGAVSDKECIDKCGAGEFFSRQNLNCSKCSPGTYMDELDHVTTSCKKCGAKKTTYGGKVCENECGVGEYFNFTIHNCAACPLGQGTKSSGETSMLACVLFTCGQGEYLDKNTGDCHLCGNGTYQSAVNHTLSSCQQCVSKASNVHGATHPNSCTQICDTFPCENGAECLESADDYCKCPRGLMGKRCEVFEMKEELIMFKMAVRFISLNWSEELSDETSVEHHRVKYQIGNAIRKVLEEDGSLVAVQVTELLSGSVIANFDLYMNDNASIVPAEALQTAVRRGSVGGLHVDYLKIKQVKCDRALGMENGRIKDESINASSESKGQEASQGRLNSAKGWHAEEATSNTYFQVRFHSNVNISAIATQGDAESSYVKVYTLLHSKDGEEWEMFVEFVNGTEAKNFTGNNDTNSIVKNVLSEPITMVKYIRVIPLSWASGIGMRMEVYGCISDPILSSEEISTTSSSTTNEKPTASNIPNVEAVDSKENEHSWGKYLGIMFGLLMVVGCLVAFVVWWRNSRKNRRDKAPLVMTRLRGAEYNVIDKNQEEYDEDAV